MDFHLIRHPLLRTQKGVRQPWVKVHQLIAINMIKLAMLHHFLDMISEGK